MRNLNIIGVILLFASGAFGWGCKEEVPENFRPVNCLDTLLTSQPHKLQIATKFSEPTNYSKIKRIVLSYTDESGYNEFYPTLNDAHINDQTYEGWYWMNWNPEKKELLMRVEENPNQYKRRIWVEIFVNPDCDLLFNIVQEGKTTEEADDAMEVKMRYKKRMYTSRVSFGENDSIIYENREVADLIAYLSKRKDVETIVTGNAINFFDSEDTEAQAEIKGLMDPGREVEWTTTAAIDASGEDSFLSRAALNPFRFRLPYELAFCGLFDDTGYSDTEIHYNMGEYGQRYDVYNMKECYQGKNLNDKVSSLAVWYGGADPNVCAVLTVWEDADFNFDDDDRTKHRVSFIATPTSRTVEWENLKKLSCLNSGDSWNDRISSMSFHFGNVGKYLADY